MDIYKDIQARTNGEIYMGVVGPVRTGKSTFIKRYMEMMVLPKISDEPSRIRAMDELPQSSGGKTIMTTEPKFIPKEAVGITLDGVSFRCRLIDCVGYMVNGAEGHVEDGRERLVKTPWYEKEIPFTRAAEIGTKKVIYDHSTVGIVVTCDGTITDLPREAYIEAEQRTIEQLCDLNKPFVILLNSRRPYSIETIELAKDLSEKYNKTVIPLNCDQLKEEDIYSIFEQLLLDFPVSSVNFYIPKWVEAFDQDSTLKSFLIAKAQAVFAEIRQMRDVRALQLAEDEYVQKIVVDNLDLSDGSVHINVMLFDHFYYQMLAELLDCEIKNEYDFMKEIKELALTKKQCKKVNTALVQSLKTGYGSVTPDKNEIALEQPELIKAGNKYGVKIKAKAPSIHLIKANITTEIAPIVGSEDQARDLISYIGKDGQKEDNIWDVNIFGKTIRELVFDGLNAKINKINQESQQKLQDTMEKIVNDSNGGMVCIII